eukprot:Phypoly_transcript_03529.p1 GENE.Phypoly_transcript_03529~~Phypoly_transcript_03529.p1  ORF type:complete len:755 (+),score=111.20 Phypoly_transcript_03529:115-2379(+)
MSAKKGDLEVTIIEARKHGIKGNALYCSVELRTQRNTPTARVHYTNALQDAKWNQTFNIDLMKLDGEELLIQVWCKRHLKKDLFLGQSLVRITALNLPKDALWYDLQDLDNKEILYTLSSAKGKKRDAYVISGEILIKLNFSHRLVVSPRSLSVSPPPSDSRQPGAISPRSYANFVTSISGKFGDKLTGNSNKNAQTTNDEIVIVESLVDEEISIDGLKERQKIVKDKSEGGPLVRTTTQHSIIFEKNEGESPQEDPNRLEQIKKNMSQLDKIMDPTRETTRPRSLPPGSQSARGRENVKVPLLRLPTKARGDSPQPNTPKEPDINSPYSSTKNMDQILLPKAQQAENSGDIELAMAYYHVVAHETQDSLARDSVARLKTVLKENSAGSENSGASEAKKHISALEAKLESAHNEITILKSKLAQVEEANQNGKTAKQTGNEIVTHLEEIINDLKLKDNKEWVEEIITRKQRKLREFDDRRKVWEKQILTRGTKEAKTLLKTVQAKKEEVESLRFDWQYQKTVAEETRKKYVESKREWKQTVKCLKSYLEVGAKQCEDPINEHFYTFLDSIKHLALLVSTNKTKCAIRYAWEPEKDENKSQSELDAKLLKLKSDLCQAGIETVLETNSEEANKTKLGENYWVILICTHKKFTTQDNLKKELQVAIEAQGYPAKVTPVFIKESHSDPFLDMICLDFSHAKHYCTHMTSLQPTKGLIPTLLGLDFNELYLRLLEGYHAHLKLSANSQHVKSVHTFVE